MFKKFALTFSAAALMTVFSTALMADNVNGPQVNRTSVLAYSTDRYTQVFFRGSETAYVEADGDGSTTLHIEVYDQNGVLINSVSGYSPWIRWTPKWTGAFTVRVHNEGGLANQYVLRTN